MGNHPEKISELYETFPLIPLRDVVVFPGTLVPFIIGRKSSLEALQKALDGDRRIFLSTQMDPTIYSPQPKDIFSFGVIATIVQHLKAQDERTEEEGNVKVVVEGIKRARIIEYKKIIPFYEVLTKPILKIVVPFSDIKEHIHSVMNLFEEYVKLSQNINFESIIPSMRENDPDRIADIIASHLNISVIEKQNLLETLNPIERLLRLSFIIEMEIAKIQYQGRDKQKRKTDGKKPFGERFRLFSKEPSRKEEQGNEIEEFRHRIENSDMPPEAKEKAMKELERLESMPALSAEATVSRNYLDWLLSIPWGKRSKEKKNIKLAEKILNEDHYGLFEVKERILEYLAIRQLVKNPKGAILCFIGPPGVGKSSLGKSIARATGRKFVRLSLGGVRDEAEIRGHRRTYIGAYPGQIIQMMKKAETKNPVFLLDEIDKMSMDFRGDPAAALMEVLDPEQNNTFVDHYIDTEYDLSQVMFITTGNIIQPIPQALLDRMEIIRIPGYTETEKLEIAKGFLVKKQLKMHGLKEKNIKFTDEAILAIIRKYTREAGVRNLEREISSIVRKIAKQVVANGKDYFCLVDDKKIEEFLGIPKYRVSKGAKESEIGAAQGLAWTEFGGELLTFEATMVKGKGNLTLTGHLGEIMQESGQAAFSYVRSKLLDWKIDRDIHKEYDIHIHVPEGAIPKEGPSAGITIATAIISLITKIPVRKDIAMTGEITLRGKVLPIGGIKEKLLAAHRAEVKNVIIPKDNEADLKDVPEQVRNSITIYLVENMDKVLELSLVKPISSALFNEELEKEIVKTKEEKTSDSQPLGKGITN
ncbi:MAG: endopeptidase La [Acidobacteriota bacterium]